jgi:putative ABC transport system ATP-binding protein
VTLPLSIEGASFREAGHGVVEDLTLSVGPGEIVMVTGPSGTGKSLVMRGAAGLAAPRSGRVLLFGGDVARMHHDALMAARQRTAYASENAPLVANLTVRDNLATPLLLRGMTWSDTMARVDTALERLGIAAHATNRPHELSQVQHRLAILARALVVPADLMILDEPSRGLDEQRNDVVADLLRMLASDGTAVLLSIGDPSRWQARVSHEVVLTLPRTA